MPEREFFDYEEWLRSGGDPTYGQAVSPTPQAPESGRVPTQNDRDWTPPNTPGLEWRWVEGSGWRAFPTNPGIPAPNPGGIPQIYEDIPPPGGGGGSGGFGYLTEPFTRQAPSYRPGPTYTAPKWEPPPDFFYKPYEAPNETSMLKDPSYQFRKSEGEGALANRAASMGTYRTGGTMKDFINYNQNAASQEYSNINSRAVEAHNLGLSQALGTYGVNYGVNKDQRDYLFDASKAEFAPQQRESELMNERDFASFLADYDIFERNRKRAGDYLTWAADQGNP